MSVIIRLQNLPWSANALDIRNYFRGLSIPEGGVHIVGGELGDAFIAFRYGLLILACNANPDANSGTGYVPAVFVKFVILVPPYAPLRGPDSTDEDARQAMMLDCGKIKEIQVKLLLSSRSEMHKVIEQARQTVPILTLTAPAPAPAPPPPPAPVLPAPAPTITPFSAALGSSMSGYGIPGIGNPNEIPQPAVIEPPAPLISPTEILDDSDDRNERKRSKDKDRRRTRSRSRSRDRDRKDRKRDRRDRSRSRERRRRDRSRSRDRRDRKRDRKDRSRSRDRSERSSPRRSHDRRNIRKSPDKTINLTDDVPAPPPAPVFGNVNQPNAQPNMQQIMNKAIASMQGSPKAIEQPLNRFTDPAIHDAYNKLNELGKKRNPNAFQGDQNGGNNRFASRGGAARGSTTFRREGRSRFENDQPNTTPDCCVAIRNAPNHTSYGDVRRFFPFLIDKHGIKMINDNTGRRTGNIFVRFCDPRSKQLALQRKINELKGESVVVEALDDDAYESAVDSYMPFRDDNALEREDNQPRAPIQAAPICTVLRLSELPNFVKEHDIIKTFSDFSLLSIMLNDCRLTRTKTAFVQFAKPEEARMAFERRNNYAFGKRLPIITAVTDEEYEKEKAIQMQAERIDFPVEPAEVEVEPVVEPAAPRDPRQRRFEAQPQQPGQGQQPVFFASPFVPPQQPFAGNFAGAQFGGFPGTGNMDPRTAAATWASRPGFPNQMQPPIQPQSGPDMDEELDCVLMKGLPCDATDRTIVTFLSDTGAVPARIHLMLDPAGVPSGDCFCEFRTASEARRAASKHGQHLEGCRVTIDLVPRGVVEEALEGPKQPDLHDGLMDNGMHGNGPHVNGPPFFDSPRGAKRGGFRGRGFDRGGYDRGGFDRGYDRGGYNRGGFDQGRGWNDRGRGYDRGRGRGGFDRGRGRGRGRGGFENGRDTRDMREDDDAALEDFGAPGCVLSLENVPFRASVDDLLSFFGDFELTQDDVIRRYNERGQPTGDARVAFRTPFDAQRALNTRHMGTIQDRRVTLTLL